MIGRVRSGSGNGGVEWRGGGVLLSDAHAIRNIVIAIACTSSQPLSHSMLAPQIPDVQRARLVRRAVPAYHRYSRSYQGVREDTNRGYPERRQEAGNTDFWVTSHVSKHLYRLSWSGGAPFCCHPGTHITVTTMSQAGKESFTSAARVSSRAWNALAGHLMTRRDEVRTSSSERARLESHAGVL